MNSDGGAHTTGQNEANKLDREGFLVFDKEKKDIKEFGQYLRRERELRNISLEEIARVTRINFRYLVALEEGSEEDLPALPFIKGFIAAFAKHIGLNHEEVLTYFEDVRTKHSPGIKMVRPSSEKKSVKRPVILAVILSAGIALLITYAITKQKARISFQKDMVSLSVPTPALEVEETSEAPLEESEIEQLPLEVKEVSSQNPVSEDKNSGLALLLEAVGKTWIYAIIDEQRVRDFFLQPGEKEELKAQKVINLTLGNAGGVKISFNGKDLGLLGQSNEVKREIVFRWDPEKGPEMQDTFTHLKEAGN